MCKMPSQYNYMEFTGGFFHLSFINNQAHPDFSPFLPISHILAPPLCHFARSKHAARNHDHFTRWANAT